VRGVVGADGVDDGVAESFAFQCVCEQVGVGGEGVIGGEGAEGRRVKVLDELFEGADGEVGFAELGRWGDGLGRLAWARWGIVVVVGDEERVFVVGAVKGSRWGRVESAAEVRRARG
jgi:hypothetical protein